MTKAEAKIKRDLARRRAESEVNIRYAVSVGLSVGLRPAHIMTAVVAAFRQAGWLATAAALERFTRGLQDESVDTEPR